jgi:aspartate aminotransferase/aminotransferase
VLSGASKSLGMPGWRIGWMLAPRELSEKVYSLQQFSFVCAPAPLQWGALAGMELDFSPHRREYQNKRDLVFEGLRENYRAVMPTGSFYMFPELPAGLDMDRFIEACIRRELLVVPGSACSDRATHFRLCFAATDEKLKRAVAILNDIATGR